MSLARPCACCAVCLCAAGCLTTTEVRVLELDQLSLAIPTKDGPKTVLTPRSADWVTIPSPGGGRRASWFGLADLQFCCSARGAPEIHLNGRIDIPDTPTNVLRDGLPEADRLFRLALEIRKQPGKRSIDPAPAWLQTPSANVSAIRQVTSPIRVVGAFLLLWSSPFVTIGSLALHAVRTDRNGRASDIAVGTGLLTVGLTAGIPGLGVLVWPNQTEVIWRAPPLPGSAPP